MNLNNQIKQNKKRLEYVDSMVVELKFNTKRIHNEPQHSLNPNHDNFRSLFLALKEKGVFDNIAEPSSVYFHKDKLQLVFNILPIAITNSSKPIITWAESLSERISNIIQDNIFSLNILYHEMDLRTMYWTGKTTKIARKFKANVDILPNIGLDSFVTRKFRSYSSFGSNKEYKLNELIPNNNSTKTRRLDVSSAKRVQDLIELKKDDLVPDFKFITLLSAFVSNQRKHLKFRNDYFNLISNEVKQILKTYKVPFPKEINKGIESGIKICDSYVGLTGDHLINELNLSRLRSSQLRTIQSQSFKSRKKYLREYHVERRYFQKNTRYHISRRRIQLKKQIETAKNKDQRLNQAHKLRAEGFSITKIAEMINARKETVRLFLSIKPNKSFFERKVRRALDKLNRTKLKAYKSMGQFKKVLLSSIDKYIYTNTNKPKSSTRPMKELVDRLIDFRLFDLEVSNIKVSL